MHGSLRAEQLSAVLLDTVRLATPTCSHATYADFRDRYRDMARTLGFEGHIAWAEAMP